MKDNVCDIEKILIEMVESDPLRKASFENTWYNFLYDKIIKLSKSIIYLNNKECFDSVSIIYRSLLESFIDFCMLCKYPEFENYLRWKDLEQNLKFKKDDRLKNLGINSNHIEEINEDLQKLEALDPNCKQYDNFEYKLKLLKIESAYLSYRLTSKCVHSRSYKEEWIKDISNTCLKMLPVTLEEVKKRVRAFIEGRVLPED